VHDSPQIKKIFPAEIGSKGASFLSMFRIGINRSLAEKPANQPYQNAQQYADHQASCNWKVKSSFVALPANVSRQMAEPRYGRSDNPHDADSRYDQSGNQKNPSDTRVIIHGAIEEKEQELLFRR
jgi:hypothetical protein